MKYKKCIAVLLLGVVSVGGQLYVLAPTTPNHAPDIQVASNTENGEVEGVAVTCTRIVDTNGSDTNPGTEQAPWQSIQKLATSLTAGQTGCIKNGTYSVANSTNTLTLTASGTSTSRIVIRSYPGHRATIKAGVWIKGNFITMEKLNFDGSTNTETVSLPITGDDAIVQDSDITDKNTGICVSPGLYNGERAERTIIQRNRIHNCGRLPVTNHDHGIYSYGFDTQIIGNWIYDNADYGVHLYPDAQRNVIKYNVIDGNGMGMTFAGLNSQTSNDNVAENNVISNAKVRWLFGTYWEDAVGTGNVVRNNCYYATNATPYYNSNNGIDPEVGGFTLSGVITGDPRYVDRANKDFRLGAGSPCIAVLPDNAPSPLTNESSDTADAGPVGGGGSAPVVGGSTGAGPGGSNRSVGSGSTGTSGSDSAISQSPDATKLQQETDAKAHAANDANDAAVAAQLEKVASKKKGTVTLVLLVLIQIFTGVTGAVILIGKTQSELLARHIQHAITTRLHFGG